MSEMPMHEIMRKYWYLPAVIRYRLSLRWRIFKNSFSYRIATLASVFWRGRARKWRERLARPGALLVEGGDAGRVDGNWLGSIRLAKRGETWPCGRDGRPMMPVVQMNVAESPFVPELLRGVRMLTMYVSAPNDDYETIYVPDWEHDEPKHGDGWCVRMYRDGDELEEVSPPAGTRLPRPTPMHWEYLSSDSPNIITEVCDASYLTRVAYDDEIHRQGTRLGGWPTFIQGAWPWRPWSSGRDAPMYLFQVHGGDGFEWGDCGAASIGVHEDGRLVISVQCY